MEEELRRNLVENEKKQNNLSKEEKNQINQEINRVENNLRNLNNVN